MAIKFLKYYSVIITLKNGDTKYGHVDNLCGPIDEYVQKPMVCFTDGIDSEATKMISINRDEISRIEIEAVFD